MLRIKGISDKQFSFLIIILRVSRTDRYMKTINYFKRVQPLCEAYM